MIPLLFLIYPLSFLFNAFFKVGYIEKYLKDEIKSFSIVKCFLLSFIETIIMGFSYQLGLKISLLFYPYHLITFVCSSTLLFLASAWILNIIPLKNVLKSRYRKALALAINFPIIFFSLSFLIHYDNFPPEKSLRYGSELQELKTMKRPETAWEFYNRGEENLRVGRNKEARADLTRAIELLKPVENPANNLYHLYYIRRGEANLKEKQPEAALNDFTKALEINPQYMDSYFLRATAYYRIGQYDNAITDIDFYIRHLPNDASAKYLRDKAHEQKEKSQ